MTTDAFSQFQKLLRDAHSVLILLPQNPSGDALGAGWGLAHFLTNKDLHATIAFADPHGMADAFSFLPRPTDIIHTLNGSRDFVLVFNTEHNPILASHTEQTENEYKIYVTPQKGSVDPRDFSFVPARFPYDLTVVIGATDKENLGILFDENPDLFYEVPTVVVSARTADDAFGQIHLTSLTASSASEVLAQFFETMDGAAIDERVSQCLLAGIVSATDSFQGKNTTPKALQIASDLMNRGADQQEIVRHLYKKMNSLELLKLWGIIMARLQWHAPLHLAWSFALQSDFADSSTSPSHLIPIIERIKRNYASGKVFVIIYEDAPNHFSALVEWSRLGSSAPWHEKDGETMRTILLRGTSADAAQQELLSRLDVSPTA